jgi:hypothetical protein
MNKKTFALWIGSLLLVTAVSALVVKTWFCISDEKQAEEGSMVKDISPIQSMENDVKWTRCFRAADGGIYFEDHRMSRDGGKTVVVQHEVDVEDINGAPERAILVRDDLFYALDGPTRVVKPGIYEGRAWRSGDGLKTIREEEVTFNVPEGPLHDAGEGEWYGIYVYRTILEMPDGHWLMTMYGNFTADSILPPDADAQRELTCMQRSFMVTSDDEGHTWNYLSTIAFPRPGDPVGEGFVEPAITRLEDGRLLCIMRSGHRFPLYASWSNDGGVSWSPPMYTGLDRGCDPCLITLQDGRIALSWGRRFPEGWSTVTPEGDKGRFEFPGDGYTSLSISDDGGLTWCNHKIIKRSGTCYSTIIEVEPGVIFMLVDEWYCRISLVQNGFKKS